MAIKNFCIIAHIDHGKSTLSDRLMEIASCQSFYKSLAPQALDSMDIERERGITIKLNFVRLQYKGYQLNLIDTPGHVDFAYEVSRSIAACEGAILLVDAIKGIQSQTISNYSIAKKNNLKIIPVVNKIDVLAANKEIIIDSMTKEFGFKKEEILQISAKSGLGCEGILNNIIDLIPAAETNNDKPLKALIFDVLYDRYKGVIIFVRVFEGKITNGLKIYLMQSNLTYTVIGIEIKTPDFQKVNTLLSGEVGCFYANIKNIKAIKIGDTVTEFNNKTDSILSGFEAIQPMVFASIYPQNSEGARDAFKTALDRLSLSDSSLDFKYESSTTLGFGARCGFLGLLHVEIIKERLLKEFDMPIIISAPSVKYEILLTNGEIFYLTNPCELPDMSKIKEIREPFVHLELLLTQIYIGPSMDLTSKYRGEYIDTEYLNENQVKLIYEIPLSEIIYDFYDEFKSITNGYGTINYQFIGYKNSVNIVKVDILINSDIFPQLSFMTNVLDAQYKASKLTLKIKELIPPHLFEIPIQAAINKRIISRETIKARGKNVIAKCYGGDITRKKKLWEAQKKGKKRMQKFGHVELPISFFEHIYKK